MELKEEGEVGGEVSKMTVRIHSMELKGIYYLVAWLPQVYFVWIHSMELKVRPHTRAGSARTPRESIQWNWKAYITSQRISPRRIWESIQWNWKRAGSLGGQEEGGVALGIHSMELKAPHDTTTHQPPYRESIQWNWKAICTRRRLCWCT